MRFGTFSYSVSAGKRFLRFAAAATAEAIVMIQFSSNEVKWCAALEALAICAQSLGVVVVAVTTALVGITFSKQYEKVLVASNAALSVFSCLSVELLCKCDQMVTVVAMMVRGQTNRKKTD